MPAYDTIKNMTDTTEKKRVVEKLLLLRAQLDREIPAKTAADTLLLATWNIRRFGDNRRDESLHYMAEIISRFDIVAVQEVSANMAGLQKLIALLGPNWDYLVTDSTDGAAGGGERMAFIFDRYKARFRKMSGEIVLSENNLIGQKLQFARTPYSVAFQAGWFRFILTTVHLYFGTASRNNTRRLEEVAAIVRYFNRRASKENENYILLGDFNVFHAGDDAIKTLEENGFYIPHDIRKHPTDLGATKYYDQIAFKLRMEPRMVVFSEETQCAGAFDFTQTIYAPRDLEIYREYFSDKVTTGKTEKQIENYYLTNWRTFQMSDHLPLWIELRIDFSNQFLEKIPK